MENLPKTPTIKFNTEIFAIGIESKLKKLFGKNYHDFQKAMTKSHAVITGSFIVKSILNERWTDNDIDIFIPCGSKSQKRIRHFFKTNFNVNLYDGEAGYIECSEPGKKFITEVSTYAIDPKMHEELGNEIQLIFLTIDKHHIVPWLEEMFDFDIVKNFYNYHRHSDSKISEPKLSIHSPLQIISREFDFKYTESKMGSEYRADKYSKRGFKINNYVPTQDFKSKNLIYYCGQKKFIADGDSDED